MIRVVYIYMVLITVLSLPFAGTDGQIRGIVRDVSGEPLPGVQVFIEELGQGATTGVDGSYIILNIQVGQYEVKARMIGYALSVHKEVSVTMDQTMWLNIVMVEEAIEGEVITVSGEKKLVEAGTTSKKITVNQEAIEALPIKDVSELYSLQSGVVKIEGGMRGAIPDHEERGLEEVHVRGGRSGEIAYMIDGLYIRNPIYGGIGNGTRLNLFAINEFDWQPGGFNSEYGDAMSAVSNMHTSSGKEKFRYRFKYESSFLGAAIGNKYDELRGYNDYNMGFGGKVPLVHKYLSFVNGLYYWASGQYTDNKSYRVYEFDDKVYSDDLQQNRADLVTPWDQEAGLRSFGFDKTFDYFIKLNLNMLNNKLRINYSFWNVDAHRKGFSSRYLYWDEGQNEIFRDTWRHTVEVNHTLSTKTFYTLRYSNFIQDQFIGSRWLDSDNDGYPDWFENSYGAGSPYYSYINGDMTSDVNNDNQIPFDPNQATSPTEIYYTNRDGNGPDQWSSGWYYGAHSGPGNYNWEVAEEFIDVNGDGIFTEYFDANGNGSKDINEPWIDIFHHEHFTDLNGDGIWNSGEDFIDQNANGIWDEYDFDSDQDDKWTPPALVNKAEFRDGDYWLTPEMYVDYEPFFDENAWWYNIQNDPYYANIAEYNASSWNELYFTGWTEERAFGGSDAFYGTSTAQTDEIRLDITSQLTDKWRARIGTDLKKHKLNFYEIKNPWDDGSAIRQRFAEYWDDVGLDSTSYLDHPDNLSDTGEGNGTWDCGWHDADGDPETPDTYNCEPYSDFNGDEKWNDYVEPLEVAGYWQNTFEVPWMVINAGIRIDGVHYKTKIWKDPYTGDYSPYQPFLWRDCGADGLCPDDGELYPGKDLGEMDGEFKHESDDMITTDVGMPYSQVFFKNAEWLWKISPRLGFSHVITDQATFTFNYGLYYQTPIYQNVYRNTNRADSPQETFEDSEGQIGNATMTASRTQSYEFGFNVQFNRNWAFSLMGWVKDMDQLVTAKTYRTGIYTYQVAANGDYGTATGIDFTLENRGLLINTMLQYTYSIAKANGAYDAAAFGNQYVDAPSQQYLMPFDRTHDLALSMYTFLPFGVTASMTHFYQSGFPYTPVIFSGDKPQSDQLNVNSKRSPDWYWANLAFSKSISFSDFKVSLGLNIYNVFNSKNETDIYELTGNADDPGKYYTDRVALPQDGGEVSSAYFDRPWMYMSPQQINFFMRLDFK